METSSSPPGERFDSSFVAMALQFFNIPMEPEGYTVMSRDADFGFL